ncbi:ABC transporter substrate-binding protein [Roseibium sp. SCP14]|uniref:ABC transporter substrate-binding protein n=1 Tax=Roseibium sp. SCP14 TaxID=3141375 RepID=UPI003A97DD27
MTKYRSGAKRTWRRCALALTLGVAVSPLALIPGAHAGGALVVAQQQDPQNLDPIDTFRLAWGSIASNIFDGLIHRTEDLELQPGLAESWEFLEDNKRIRFTLRQNVKFHNGEPFNADAVKFTFDRLLGEEGKKGPQRSNYTSIESVEVVDDYTVDFVMQQPDPVLLTKLAGYGAMIVPPKYIEEVGEKAFDMKPVGTGPFKVVNYTPAVSVELEKFDGYWNGKAELDKVTVRIIPEPATRMAELLSGGVDISLNIPTTAVDTVENSDAIDLLAVPGPRVEFLRIKTTDAVTEDKRVRQAIIKAIDRKAIIDALLKGHGSEISSLQGAMSFGYDPELEAYPYDPAGAKALLAEAGVKNGTEIVMDIRNNDDTFREVAQVISSYLGAVGLKVKLKSHETGVYFGEIIPNGATGELFQFGWGGWTFDFDNTAYLLYHSGERWNPYIQDEKLDALLESQRQTYDGQVRQKVLREVAEFAHENALDVPLFNFATLYGVNKRVKGFVPAPDIRVRYTSVTVD